MDHDLVKRLAKEVAYATALRKVDINYYYSINAFLASRVSYNVFLKRDYTSLPKPFVPFLSVAIAFISCCTTLSQEVSRNPILIFSLQ